MSQKSVKSIRRQIKKLNKKVFKDFTVEISAMSFWTRLKFCMKMAFLRQPLQKSLKAEIQARREYNREGVAIKPKHRSFRLTRAGA